MDWFLFDKALHQERVNKLKHHKHYMRNFIEKETSKQVFSSEFCKIFKNIFFTEHLRMINFEKIMT